MRGGKSDPDTVPRRVRPEPPDNTPESPDVGVDGPAPPIFPHLPRHHTLMVKWLVECVLGYGCALTGHRVLRCMNEPRWLNRVWYWSLDR